MTTDAAARGAQPGTEAGKRLLRTAPTARWKRPMWEALVLEIEAEARQQGRATLRVEQVFAALRAVDERVAAALRADGYPEHADDLLNPAEDKGRRDYAAAIVAALAADDRADHD